MELGTQKVLCKTVWTRYFFLYSLGDHIRLAYTCADEFGLRYEFQLGQWRATKWDGTDRCPMPPRAAASWPE